MKITKFLSSRAFYFCLATGLIAVGVAAWSAVSSINSPDDQKENQSYSEETPSYIDSIPEEPADKSIEDKPYESEQDKDTSVSNARPVADVFIVPISGKIQKGFDSAVLQYSATYGDMRIHLGLDISASVGSEIVASGNGYVTNIYQDALLGNVVEIDHGNGIVIKYCGLDKTIAVSNGQDVIIGQKIGITSSVPAECGDDPHIHIEVYENGKCVSPIETLALE